MCIATPGRLSSEIDTEVDTHRIIEITEGASTLMIEIRCQGDQGGSDERGPPVDDGSPVTCAPRGTPSTRRDSSPASYPSPTGPTPARIPLSGNFISGERRIGRQPRQIGRAHV